MELGQIVVTPGAGVVLEEGESEVLLNRHRNGDYGNITNADACINEFSMEDGSWPIRSLYRTRNGHQIVVLTEAHEDLIVTKVALPQELYDKIM